MITDLEYLSLSVLEYMRIKIYFAESRKDILSHNKHVKIRDFEPICNKSGKRIQCLEGKVFNHSITSCRINAYALLALGIVAHVTIMTPFCPYQSPFFRLIRTPIITIDWVL